jgi:hypothetical protein
VQSKTNQGPRTRINCTEASNAPPRRRFRCNNRVLTNASSIRRDIVTPVRSYPCKGYAKRRRCGNRCGGSRARLSLSPFGPTDMIPT